ncbi:radical SAM protein [Hymenobacter arizonensis]|uniref:Radical SAM superfamily enzyme, MoaA/NifB/PqqE/SkfB family n=1 Tax=Hymenobacter arizonensis TaxID=1227077 RepID=A0A1I5Z372_HYMAR|nr:radical SAM protein [Hymenobacter arizonensis]SFQ50902.1 Radical SAM superfamily enzyme, MoaA/NifB/PqqE/SkfB family [Hymenobacter arizonensis]
METTLITDLTYVEAPAAPVAPPHLPATMLTTRLKRACITAVFYLVEARLLWRYLRTPARIKLAAERIKDLKRAYYGELAVRKIACVAGRYYREYQTPGWPSPAYDTYVATTVNRLVPFRADTDTLNLVFLAITKKCPLACDHCFEWDALNQKETLTRAHIHEMVATFQARHVSQIFFSGGEPMLRVNDLVAVVEAAQPGTDFWVITSGFNFTRENAGRLKQAGFTGVTISLDHHDAARHNAFRGSPQAYNNAVQAAAYASEVGLVVNLSLCATQEFTTEANLMAYARLARQLGVAFIQVLEPRAVGHYAGKAVDPSPAQIALLEAFYLKLNYGSEYLDWPMVHYYGYHQRRMGCGGAADRFLYVDTDGDLHACPFCQKKSGSALCGSLDDSLAALKTRGCHPFKSTSI